MKNKSKAQGTRSKLLRIRLTELEREQFDERLCRSGQVNCSAFVRTQLLGAPEPDLGPYQRRLDQIERQLDGLSSDVRLATQILAALADDPRLGLTEEQVPTLRDAILRAGEIAEILKPLTIRLAAAVP